MKRKNTIIIDPSQREGMKKVLERLGGVDGEFYTKSKKKTNEITQCNHGNNSMSRQIIMRADKIGG